jgi:hypothetical protein|tara:strand:- start:457 stop:861 length:405 start_codon:yes stop_codon:yes gene_type:complete
MPFNYTVSNLPLLVPVRVILPAATANQIISFPDRFLGRAVSIKITNNDAANAATYAYNQNAQFSNLAPSSFDTLDGTIINFLTVNTGAAGTVLVEAQCAPLVVQATQTKTQDTFYEVNVPSTQEQNVLDLVETT